MHSGLQEASLDRVSDVAVFYHTSRNVANNNTDRACAQLHSFNVF